MCHHSDYYNKKVPDSIDKSVDKQLFKSSSRKYRLKMIRSSHSEKKVEETKGKKFYPQTQKKKLVIANVTGIAAFGLSPRVMIVCSGIPLKA